MVTSVATVWNPETMYNPLADASILSFDYLGQFRFYRDGSVKPIHPDTPMFWESRSPYPTFNCNGSNYVVHQVIGKVLWPRRPNGLTFIDHINRIKTDNSWSNLRPVSPSINGINKETKRKIRGWDHETEEWLAKINASLAKKRKPVWRSSKSARNKYISRITYKGTRYELGEFETPEEAHHCYKTGREPFIQKLLREIWTQFLK